MTATRRSSSTEPPPGARHGARALTRRVAWVLIAALALALAVPGALIVGDAFARGTTPPPPGCARQAGQFQTGPPVAPAITLTPDLATQTINFGGGRGTQFADIVLKASRPLPATVSASQLDIQVLRRFTRQSNTLATVALPGPTFTPPELSPQRDVVDFTICFAGSGISAGHYEGAITVEGPTGIAPTTLAFNVNAQDETLFLITLSVAGALVLLLLFWRGATSIQSDAAQNVATQVHNADANPQGVMELPANAAIPARTATQPNARWSLKKNVITDPLFWAGTLLSSAAAIAAAWTVYTSNTGWGSDPVTDVFGIISTIIAAAGFQSLIATAAGK